jgi:hypothetical protein
MMELEKHDRGRIMACPAVRLSVEIRRPSRLLQIGDKRVLVLGRPSCSDEEDCEFLEGPSCLLPMLRDVPVTASDLQLE